MRMSLSRYRTSLLEGLANEESILVSSPSYPFFRFESTLLSRTLRSSYRLPLTVTANESLFHAFASLTFKRTVYDERRTF